jgi:hypothetical protein
VKAFAVAVVAAVLAVSGCAATGHRAASPAPAASPNATPAPAAAAVSSPAETCQALTDMDVLSAAEGFVLIGDVVQLGDVTNTVISLESIQRDAAAVFRTALGNIIDTLRSLDAAVTDGIGGTVDTTTVQPDARLLAGMCRARGLAVPAVI